MPNLTVTSVTQAGQNLTVKGTATAGGTVEIKAGGVSKGTVVVGNDSNWSMTFATAAADGPLKAYTSDGKTQAVMIPAPPGVPPPGGG